MKLLTLPPFTAATLVEGGQFRTSATQGVNHRATKVTRYLSTGPGPKRTMLEVVVAGRSAPFIFEEDTPLYCAK